MNKAAGLGAGGAFRCLQSQHELIAVIGCLLQDEGIFEKDRPAGPRVHQALLPVREPITSASTAMRTATPLRT